MLKVSGTKCKESKSISGPVFLGFNLCLLHTRAEMHWKSVIYCFDSTKGFLLVVFIFPRGMINIEFCIVDTAGLFLWSKVAAAISSFCVFELIYEMEEFTGSGVM